MASEYPFKQIIGVELSEDLHECATQNIKSYRSRTQKCANVRSVLQDASAFQFPEGPLIVYLFNPFKEKILTNVLQRLEKSVSDQPRHTIIIYFYPSHKEVLDKLNFLVPVPFEDHVRGPVRRLMPVHRQHFAQPWVAVYETTFS